jgi:hypothetical protein
MTATEDEPGLARGKPKELSEGERGAAGDRTKTASEDERGLALGKPKKQSENGHGLRWSTEDGNVGRTRACSCEAG